MKRLGLRLVTRALKCLALCRIAGAELRRQSEPVSLNKKDMPCQCSSILADGRFDYPSTASDTRSNAPARRDEDRVIRPLVRSRRGELRIVRFRASAKAHSLRCLSSSGKIIRFCRRRSWRTSPGQYHLSVPVFNCRRESPYWNGITPRVVVLIRRNVSHPHKRKCSLIPPKRPHRTESASPDCELGLSGLTLS